MVSLYLSPYLSIYFSLLRIRKIQKIVRYVDITLRQLFVITYEIPRYRDEK